VEGSAVEQIVTYQTLILALVFVFVSPPTDAAVEALYGSLGNWRDYAGPVIVHLLLIRVHSAVMIAVGVAGIVAAALLPLESRLGPYVIATWLASVVHLASLEHQRRLGSSPDPY
jgi:hypothetical protein